MTTMIEQLRKDAIDDFLRDLVENGYDLRSHDARTLISEVAERFIPAYFTELLTLAGEPYGQSAANFFLLYKVDKDLLGNEKTSADQVLNVAIQEFLEEELNKALQERIREEEEKDRIERAQVVGLPDSADWELILMQEEVIQNIEQATLLLSEKEGEK